MIFRKRCIFCDRRVSKADSVWNDRFVCICRECDTAIREQEVHDLTDVKPLARVVPCVLYEGNVREAIQKYKFGGNRAYAGGFSAIAEQRLERLWEAYMFDAIVTLPLSKERMNERGFNQARFLSDAVGSILGIPVHDEYLVKTRDTNRQSRLKLQERIMNVCGAYRASDGVRGKNIIIVDDIYTTGATCAEAARTLRSAGAKTVMAVVFAIRKGGT